jgi:hypothetical protein
MAVAGSTVSLRRLGLDREIAAACLLTAVACAAAYGGLFSHAYPGDTSLYQTWGREVVQGHHVPYRWFFVEYPPGAIPVFVLPEWISDAHYLIVFKLWMTGCAMGFTACAGWICRRLGLSLVRLAPAVLAPVLMGPVFLNRFDPLVAFVAMLGLVAILRARERSAGVWLGIGTAVKLFPVLVLPMLVRRALATRRLRPAAIGFAAASIVLWGWALAVGPGGVHYSFTVQIERHLQTESLASSILLAGSKLGIHHVQWIEGFGSIDLGGRVPHVAGIVTSVVSFVLVVLVVWLYSRGAGDDERLVTAFAAAIAAFAVFGKVLSPQYLTWLVPLVPLAAGRRGLWAGGTLLFALALSMPEYLFWGRYGVRDQNWTVWLLLFRNGLLVTMFCFLVAELRQREPVRERFARGS